MNDFTDVLSLSLESDRWLLRGTDVTKASQLTDSNHFTILAVSVDHSNVDVRGRLWDGLHSQDILAQHFYLLDHLELLVSSIVRIGRPTDLSHQILLRMARSRVVVFDFARDLGGEVIVVACSRIVV